MQAIDVKSPIHRTRNHVVRFESPSYWHEEWSIVEAEVLAEDGETWSRSIGIRWDGDRDDPDSKGFPNSSGKAVWFWIPTKLEPFFYGIIIPELLKRKRADKRERRAERRFKALVQQIDGLKSQMDTLTDKVAEIA